MQFAKRFSLAVGVLLLLAVGSSALAQNSGSVGGKPANPRDDNPRTRSIFVHEIEPGKSVKDAVLIINNANEKKSVLVYPTDAQVASGGAFACEQKADKADQTGSWIKMDKNELSLGPGESQTIGFTISVPKDASVGEHNACIAIQALEAATPSGVDGVQLNFRSAIRVAITVPGEFEKGLSFESLSIQRKGRTALLVTQSLRNSGNVSLDTTLDTSIRTLIGTKVEQNGGDYPILAGQTSEFNFEFKRPFIGGLYRVVAVASYNNDPTTSLGEQGSSEETIQTSKFVFIMPHPLALLLYAIILAAIAFPIIRNRKKKQRLAQLHSKSIVHTVKKGESITSISERYQAEWHDTALLNNLKAPFALKVGSEIRVAPGASYKATKKVSRPKTQKKKSSTNNKKSTTKSKRKTKPKS